MRFNDRNEILYNHFLISNSFMFSIIAITCSKSRNRFRAYKNVSQLCFMIVIRKFEYISAKVAA